MLWRLRNDKRENLKKNAWETKWLRTFYYKPFHNETKLFVTPAMGYDCEFGSRTLPMEGWVPSRVPSHYLLFAISFQIFFLLSKFVRQGPRCQLTFLLELIRKEKKTVQLNDILSKETQKLHRQEDENHE